MVKIASIGLAIAALAMAALPANADSQTIGPLIGTANAPHWARSSQQQPLETLRQEDSAFASTGYAEGAGLPQKTCGHVGGPKIGTWSCR